MLEVFTKEGIDSQKAKDFIFNKTGMMPAIYDNSSHCASPVVQTSSSSLPLVLGLIYGYVGGPTGLPAIGTAGVAAEQQTGYTVNSIVSIDSQHSFNLPQGKDIVLVTYPDGINKKVRGFQAEQGMAYSLDFRY